MSIRRKSMSKRLGSGSAVGALVAGALSFACTFEPANGDGAEVAETTEAVTRAPATREAPWSVRILGDTNCTAEALTPNWLLTAAHCLFGKPAFAFGRTVTAVNPNNGSSSTVFDGGATYILHPSYVHESSDRVHDFALVLLDGNGMNLPSFTRLYNDSREPWAASFTGSRAFEVAGFGKGTDPTGASDCDSGALGTKRLGTEFGLTGKFLSSGGVPMKVTGKFLDDQQLCDGDSGSPWMLRRGHTLMQFAIHSGSRGAVSGGDKAASLIKPKLGFITQETANRGRPIECFQDTKDGFSFLSCQNKRVRVFVEAENGVLGAPMAIGNSANASFAKFISVPGNATSPGGSARLTAFLPQTDRYFVWARVFVPSSTPSAFTISVDGSVPRDLPADPSPTGSFQWIALRLATVLTGFNLGTGNHTIDLGRGLAGAQVDQVLLTTDPLYVPFESFVESESGTLVAPMTFVRKISTVFSPISGTGYIRVPDGSAPLGLAIYNFTVPSRSDYFVWGRTLSPDTNHNSFKIMFDADSDNDDWSWQTPVSSGWFWSGMNGTGKGLMRVMLDAGNHWMALKQAETGTAIDRMLITNNPSFSPAEPPLVIGPVIGTLEPANSGSGAVIGDLGSGVAVGGFTRVP
jgi:hypothetical protein